MTDEELFRAYLAGDEAGLRQLIERYGDSLTLYLNGYIHDPGDAEDLMVEAFARTVRAKPKLTGSTFRAYLYKTGRNLALRFKAWRMRSQAFSFEELEQEPESGVLLRLCRDPFRPQREPGLTDADLFLRLLCDGRPVLAAVRGV
ncbi:MAG: sigma-70 family RNA polymerase sigma factor [Lachnospiraceae bacterium]|nr:sigma-70 family RNA polymerase sigma factor [Lachnospiraceae bacterium]